MAAIQGVNHIGLSVSDVQRSVEWYERVFDVKRVFEDKQDDFEIALVMIGTAVVGFLRKSPDAGDTFSEFRTGLDHFSFGVGGKADLEEWKDRLDTLGVSHSGVVESAFGHHLNFRDPDNIALEIFALPS